MNKNLRHRSVGGWPAAPDKNDPLAPWGGRSSRPSPSLQRLAKELKLPWAGQKKKAFFGGTDHDAGAKASALAFVVAPTASASVLPQQNRDMSKPSTEEEDEERTIVL